MLIATDASVSDPNARKFEFMAFKKEQEEKARLAKQEELARYEAQSLDTVFFQRE